MKREDLESKLILKRSVGYYLVVLKKNPECDFLLLKPEEIQKVLNKIMGIP
ncbi:MAG: hypothetical protein ABI416_06135 [Ginsengibacter sp.]